MLRLLVLVLLLLLVMFLLLVASVQRKYHHEQLTRLLNIQNERLSGIEQQLRTISRVQHRSVQRLQSSH